MRGLVRPLRFILVSIPLFLLWLYVARGPYLDFVGQTFASSARAFGHDVRLLERHDETMLFSYGDDGWENKFGLTSINLVPFAALVLATSGIGWKRMLRMLCFGGLILVVTHVVGLWCDILQISARGSVPAMRLADGVRALFTGFGTFMFPLLIWLVQVRDLLPLPQSGKMRY